jgi:hypothetical protein
MAMAMTVPFPLSAVAAAPPSPNEVPHVDEDTVIGRFRLDVHAPIELEVKP